MKNLRPVCFSCESCDCILASSSSYIRSNSGPKMYSRICYWQLVINCV